MACVRGNSVIDYNWVIGCGRRAKSSSIYEDTLLLNKKEIKALYCDNGGEHI